MASNMAASYRNDPWNNKACMNQILSINFVFKHNYQCQNVNRVYIYIDINIYNYNIAIKMAATTFSKVAVYLTPLCAIIIVSLA